MADNKYTVDFFKQQLPKIGKRIRDARQAMGYTQSELAHLIDISDKSVSALEVGRVEPSITQMQAIALALGKPIGAFTGEKNSMAAAKFESLMREIEDIKNAFDFDEK
jgi:DNA-binding XRE family transcriptional regulator